ncbi:hypothetical protein QTJ16_004452 [Diplocarpon rosae]|uniref:Uncharacterized protein n=1 Tax=Diplocarpon rosae TaxID=946125 RepID=A0AAD9WCE5_9HELO|nr:hypothetical protein QTJ16_004452 [Diplocarpon rosae]
MSSRNERDSDNSLEQGFAQEDAQEAMVKAGNASKNKRKEAREKREQKEREQEDQRKADAIQASLDAANVSQKRRKK